MKAILNRKYFVGVGVVLLLCVVASSQCMLIDSIGSQRARKRLLCKTDHQRLLEAGRQILCQVTKGNLKCGNYVLTRNACFPSGLPVPQDITALRPRRLTVLEDGYLIVEMHGGMDHFGVNIYPDGFKEPFPGFPLGDRKLIDGLWYYDDQYKWTDYAEVVDNMLRKCGRGG